MFGWHNLDFVIWPKYIWSRTIWAKDIWLIQGLVDTDLPLSFGQNIFGKEPFHQKTFGHDNGRHSFDSVIWPKDFGQKHLAETMFDITAITAIWLINICLTDI
jgi:hypothetical protein